MPQPSWSRRRRSFAALLSLVLIGIAGAPAFATAGPSDDPLPDPGGPVPTCSDVEAPADCPDPDPDPDPEPEPEPEPEPVPAPPDPALPAAPAAGLPAPIVPTPRIDTAPRLWAPSRGTAVRPSRSTGRLTLARLTCWQGPCTITAPRQITLRIDGKRFVARVLGARRTTSGQTSVLRLQLNRAALRSLDRAVTPTPVEVAVSIASPTSTVDQTILLSLR